MNDFKIFDYLQTNEVNIYIIVNQHYKVTFVVVKVVTVIV